MDNQQFTAQTGILLYEGAILKILRGDVEVSVLTTYKIHTVSNELIILVDANNEKEKMPIRYLYSLFNRDRFVF
jgi:hypothetical protein